MLACTTPAGDDRDTHHFSIHPEIRHADHLSSSDHSRHAVRSNSQGSRFSSALPLSGSTGTETWSCAMSQLPSIFRKHAVPPWFRQRRSLR